MKSIVRNALPLFSRVPFLASFIVGHYDSAAAAGGHPFDREHGTRTSGYIPGRALGRESVAYLGAQPSIVRRALATIPDFRECAFVDLGCGKGRPLLVAAEIGCRDVVGVEYSPPLAQIARQNAAIYAERYPERTPVRVVTGDALAYPLPPQSFVVFLYNPFGRELIDRLRSRIEASLAAHARNAYVVYVNPAHADVFDASDAFVRRFARQVPYDASEIGHGPDDSDAVVIWQHRANMSSPSDDDASAPVRIVEEGNRAVIEAAPDGATSV